MIAIWLISTWEIFGRPKTFNIIELGPGDCSLTKLLLIRSKIFLNLILPKQFIYTRRVII